MCKECKAINGIASSRFIDISGKEFGQLRAIRHIGYSKWLCKCSCGNYVIRKSCKLRIKDRDCSCGCTRKGRISREEIEHTMNEFEAEYGTKPTLSDMEMLLDRSKSRVSSYLSEYDLKDRVDREKKSRAEEEIASLVPDATLNRRDILKSGSEIDIYSESSRVGIEFNGSYWHSEKFKDKKYHINKTNEAFRQNIRLIHIFEYEWDNMEKQDKLKRLVQRAVGGTEIKKIYARKCKVKYISNRIAKDFIDKYHLQGFASSTVYYGVYYNDELVGVVTFGIPRFNKRYEYELVRLCWKDDVSVIGGAEKVFKKFIKDYDPENILSYCDISKFSGNVYKKLGFKLISISDPNYVWWSASENKILTRYQCQKHKLVKNGLGTVDETEVQIMQRLGFLRIHDCGNMVFGWEKEQ